MFISIVVCDSARICATTFANGAVWGSSLLRAVLV